MGGGGITKRTTKEPNLRPNSYPTGLSLCPLTPGGKGQVGREKITKKIKSAVELVMRLNVKQVFFPRIFSEFFSLYVLPFPQPLIIIPLKTPSGGSGLLPMIPHGGVSQMK